MHQSNVPQLRFKEFHNNFEKKLLSEVGFFKNGINKDAKDFGHGFPIVNLMDVFGKSQLEKIDFGLVNATKNELIDYAVEKGDVLFVRSSVKRTGVGQTSVVIDIIKNLTFSGFLIRFRDCNFKLDLNYKRYCFQAFSVRSQILRFATTSANTNINQESLKKVILIIPDKNEQKKISTFLTTVDSKIEKLTRKKELLEEYKKGVMQKLFSGEIRFKDENGNDYPDWEEKNGNAIFSPISNKKHNSDLPVLAVTQDRGAIPRDFINYQISATEKSVSGYKVVNIGDFIISLRSFQGGIEFSDYKGICSPAYIILRPTMDICRDLYKHYFKTDYYIQELKRKLEGIRDGKMISYKYFSEIELPFPCLPEQLKIADFINSIDSKIENASLKIDKTKEFKKGLLQQMFV